MISAGCATFFIQEHDFRQYLYSKRYKLSVAISSFISNRYQLSNSSETCLESAENSYHGKQNLSRLLFSQPKLFDHGFPHFKFLDLARDGHWEVLYIAKESRNLVVSEDAGTKGSDIFIG